VNNGEGGNGACVFEDLGYTEQQMTNYAKIIGLSEIVFISKKDSQYWLRYFTPTQEIEMCGHATLAAIQFITERWLEKPLKVSAGNLLVDVLYDEKRAYIKLGEAEKLAKVDPNVLEASVGISHKKMRFEGLGPCIYKSGIPDILLPVDTRETLHSIRVDREEMINLSKNKEVVGLHVFTMESGIIYARNFAPLYGIDEEYATGTSNNSVVHMLKAHNLLKKEKGLIIQGVEGHLGHIRYVISEDSSIYIGGDLIKETYKFLLND
jgi:PhzF family phenazine biosynthesis protein